MQKNFKWSFLFLVIFGLTVRLFAGPPPSSRKDILNTIEKGNIEEVRNALEDMGDDERNSFLDSEVCMGDCPLAHAVQSGNFNMVKLLLDFGAIIYKDSKDWCNSWLYDWALHVDKPKMADFLVEEYGERFPYILHHYVRKNNLNKVIKLLQADKFDINKKDGWKITPLCYALNNGNLDMIKFLIDRGAEYNDKFGIFHDPLIFFTKDAQVLDYLLDELHLDINERSDGFKGEQAGEFVGDTVFSSAVIMDYDFEWAEELLKRGAEINIVINARGETILHKATRLRNVKGVKLLVENGANLEVQDNEGKTPYDCAVEGVEKAREKCSPDHFGCQESRDRVWKVVNEIMDYLNSVYNQ